MPNKKLEEVLSTSEIFCNTFCIYTKMVVSAETIIQSKKETEKRKTGQSKILDEIYNQKLTPLGTHFHEFHDAFKVFYGMTVEDKQLKGLRKKWKNIQKLDDEQEKVNWLKQNTETLKDKRFNSIIQESHNLISKLNVYIGNKKEYNKYYKDFQLDASTKNFQKQVAGLCKNESIPDKEIKGYINFFLTDDMRSPEERIEIIKDEKKKSIISNILHLYKQKCELDEKEEKELENLKKLRADSKEEYKKYETQLTNIIDSCYNSSEYRKKKKFNTILTSLSSVNKSLKLKADEDKDRTAQWNRLSFNIQKARNDISKEAGGWILGNKELRSVAKNLEKAADAASKVYEFLKKK